MTPHDMLPGAARTRRRFAGWAMVAACAAAASLVACSDNPIPDLNNPTVQPSVPNAAVLQTYASGLLVGDREQLSFEILVLETMGRDAYRIDPADPRFIQMPLGQFSPGAFLSDFTWNVHYRTIKNAVNLVTGIDASSFSTEDKAAVRGFARTIQALQYIHVIDTRDTVGVPIFTAAGVMNPISCRPAVLNHISALLDSAKTDLAAAGAAFPFSLPSGFTSNGTFNTPAEFVKFNRALAAKVYMYRGYATKDSTGASAVQLMLDSALIAMTASFETDGGTLRTGIFHTYSTSSGDLVNQNFDNSVYRANPKVQSQAEGGDGRLSKITTGAALSFPADAAIASNLVFTNVSSPTTPLPIITNEELILLKAQILWGKNTAPTDAQWLALVNDIRNRAGGLGAKVLGGFATRTAMLREILNQKRYSLLWESGDRLVDFRMHGLFPTLGQELVASPPAGGPPMTITYPQAELDARGITAPVCTP
jgi:hypothetical protein